MRLGITRFDYVWIVDAVYRWVAMPDDFFRQQTAKMESLAHRDKSNTTVGYNDIFKDQSTKLESLPNKPSKKQATGKIEKKKSKEKVRCFTGMGNRIFVVITIIILLFILTTLGGIIFVEIETGNQSDYLPYDDCFKEIKENKSTTPTMALNLAQKKQKLSSLPFAWLFSWSLYATVGYGHRFPFTFYGQLVCIFYAWFIIPVYMALKIEFGEILAIIILYFGQKIKALIIRFAPECCTRKLKKESYHPSDLTLVALLFILFTTFIFILTYIVMYTSELNFWTGFYLTTLTVFQVGLGDVAPSEEWSTFVCVIPLVLFGDTLASYLNYYVHGIFRLQLHKLALCVTGCHEWDDKHVPPGKHLAMAKSVADFVTVTNHTMPLRATSAEIVRHDDSCKSIKLKPYTDDIDMMTPPESAKEENTQESRQMSYKPRSMIDDHMAKSYENSRLTSQKNVRSTTSLHKTQVDHHEMDLISKGTTSKSEIVYRRTIHDLTNDKPSMSIQSAKLRTQRSRESPTYRNYYDGLGVEHHVERQRTPKTNKKEDESKLPLLGSLEVMINNEDYQNKMLMAVTEEGLKRKGSKKPYNMNKTDDETVEYLTFSRNSKPISKRKSSFSKAKPLLIRERKRKYRNKKKEKPKEVKEKNKEDERTKNEVNLETAVDSLTVVTPKTAVENS